MGARNLLLSKDIDSKEYYQLKSDCESRIKIPRTRIDNAVKSLAQLKSRVEVISAFLSILGFAFSKAGITIKKRIITWLYGNKIIWSETCFDEHLNYISAIVYNSNNLCNAHTEATIITDFNILPATYKRVLEIESKKGQSLTSNQVQSIVIFSYEGAKLAIDIFITAELNKPEQNTI